MSMTLAAIEEQLKTISITGRMAYCTTCLEIIIHQDKLSQEAFSPLLAALWDFTSNPDLSDWEEKIQQFIPELSSAETNELYKNISSPLLTCIDEIIEVGRGNLYTGVQSYSPATLSSAMWVVWYLLAGGYPLPRMDIFQRSPFTTQGQHGWGDRVDKSFFR